MGFYKETKWVFRCTGCGARRVLGENPGCTRTVSCSKCGNVELFTGEEPQTPAAIQQVQPSLSRDSWRPSVKGVLDGLLATALLAIAGLIVAGVVYWANSMQASPPAEEVQRAK